MQSLVKPTVTGLNETIQTMKQAQKDNEDQEHFASIVAFNNLVDTPMHWKIKSDNVTEVKISDYSPNGGTALLDAVGQSVSRLRNEIQDELNDRKATVLVTIFTDGYENASTEYNQQQIMDLLTEIQAGGLWTVAFIGCGNEVFEVAESMGISRGNTLSYENTLVGTTQAYQSMDMARGGHSASIKSSGGQIDQIANTNFFAHIDIDIDIDADTTENNEGKEDDKS